jgi:hypothetical protein
MFRALIKRRKGLLAVVEVRPIQTNREYYLPSKKARALERGCIVAKKGAKCPIFENSFQAIAPLTAHEKRVHFLGEHISLKN